MRNIWINRKSLAPSKGTLIAGAVCVLSFAVPAILVFAGLSSSQSSSDAALEEKLRENICRSAALCYSIEGAYPQDIEYLEENYGLSVNRQKYTVHYSCFASNVPPEVKVSLNK